MARLLPPTGTCEQGPSSLTSLIGELGHECDEPNFTTFGVRTCKQGPICTEGACVALCAFNAACEEDADCLSQHCGAEGLCTAPHSPVAPLCSLHSTWLQGCVSSQTVRPLTESRRTKMPCTRRETNASFGCPRCRLGVSNGTLRDIFRVLPHWPKDRHLDLAPRFFKATRARLDPTELVAEIGVTTVPLPPPAA